MKKNYYLLILTLFINLFWINCASTGTLFQDTKDIVKQVISVGGDYEIAYKYRTNRPDELIMQLPQSIETYRKKNPYEFIRQLADYIDKNSTNDFERVKKAHDWIAMNIKYDIKTATHVDLQKPGTVVSRGSAVCDGYARLFKALCDAMKIKCVYIVGYVYGPNDLKHAWNKVQINGEWYLVDVTWDADVILRGSDKNNRSFFSQYKTKYLFMNPELLIFDHIPDSSRDQLLINPVSLSQYKNLKDSFSLNSFDIIDNKNPDFKTEFQTNGVLELSFLLKDDSGILIYVNVYDGKGKIIPGVASTQKVGQKEYKATINFPKKRNYVVLILSTLRSGGYALCGRFNVRVTESILNSQSNPMPILNDNWERIIIENVGSFDIPPTMELQDGPYKLNKNLLINTLSMNQMISQIIVQQKELNNFSNDSFSRYARIIFKTETGSRDKGLFLNMDILRFSKDNISTLNDVYKDATQSELSSITTLFKLRIKPMKFNPRLFCCKPPFDFICFLIPGFVPSGDFFSHLPHGGNPF